jgi:hypothetical protein
VTKKYLFIRDWVGQLLLVTTRQMQQVINNLVFVVNRLKHQFFTYTLNDKRSRIIVDP